ncbi:MAG: hypothetical protein HQ541_00365 [Mariniphaga sp.]|nr:hypothetical protein [Mariniphaga sp.]
MKKSTSILTIAFCFISINVLSQNKSDNFGKLLIKGQLSGWEHFNASNTYPLWSGARYIPQANYEIDLGENRLIDFETSANIYGNFGFKSFNSTSTNGDLKPYRFWGRYSTQQFEFRVGLQKINFGSASLLRPLMWFDQIDPRDPLQLTDGVWGALARYYFLNNTNVWLWGLYGNNNKKGWESAASLKNKPEFGGRIQIPVSKGEAALSFHHRKADYTFLEDEIFALETAENRIGFDTKLDLAVGLWMETSWVNSREDIGIFTNQEIINLGIDYTFRLGNGLTVIYEQLIVAYNEKAFVFDQTLIFSLLNMTYPIGLFDNLSAIVYYDWTNKSAYNFINWQKQFNNISLFIMGYVNPKNYNIPTQGATEMLFAGSGIQLMLVFNH